MQFSIDPSDELTPQYLIISRITDVAASQHFVHILGNRKIRGLNAAVGALGSSQASSQSR
jgi:hypothetical protein